MADAVVLKDEDIFFLTARDGSVPLGGKHGLGLYYHDCRFLEGYELAIAGQAPQGLVATAASSYMAAYELTNLEIASPDGRTIKKQRIGIKWERIIECGKLTLLDRITFRNFDVQPIEFPILLTFQAGFQDTFIVRGAKNKKTGKPRAPAWDGKVLRFFYKGVDKIYRGLAIHFTPDTHASGDSAATLAMSLRPGESKQVNISLVIAESADETSAQPHGFAQSDFGGVENALRRAAKEWSEKHATVESDSRMLNKVMARSLSDHLVLRSTLSEDHYFAGGLPWFGALFGRDSLIASLQMLAYSPSIADQTLRLLAKLQGTHLDASRAEEPGKILHELRCGELANSRQIPQTPYYGTVDATPLFLILLARHAAWTGDLTLFHQLRDNVEAALGWISKYGSPDADGYLTYRGAKSKNGLGNQGWKDSGDAIVNADGSLAEPPIALVEVQGYVYLAKTGLAELYRRADEPDRADRLLEEAAKLRSHFNQDFWLEDKNFYALALQQGNRPAAVISSNPGQALWSGIVDPNKAKLVADRLMAEDMFSGWGVRTLSEQERRYDPVGYHLGTVWPHDNSIIAMGLRRYGLDSAFQRVFDGMLEIAGQFEHHRLPELFAGFARSEFGVPVPYPEACHPQVWAAGAIPLMLQTALGLIPLGFERRLRIVRPLLPDSAQHLEIHGLKVANASVDLQFERNSEGKVGVNILDVDGDLNISIEP
ncbi:MAG: amylo-alpha-1,6-glucosidase [Candidatus Acidiferrales bacterium]